LTTIVAPIAPSQAVTNAQGTLADLLTEQEALAEQLQADLTAVGNGWETLSAADQTAVLLRMLNAFGTVMEALVASVTAAQMTGS
jgi:hypothetical protein